MTPGAQFAEARGLDLQDYLSAASSSAQRARTTSLTLIVASVLVFGGFLNSLNNSWMRQRLAAFKNLESSYVVERVGTLDSAPTRASFASNVVKPIRALDSATMASCFASNAVKPTRALDSAMMAACFASNAIKPIDALDSPTIANSLKAEAYKIRYTNYYGALVRTYVENSHVIRVPFFGITFDVNDLGIMAGLGFVVILTMLRFSTSREVDNLARSFMEAKRLNQLPDFYVLLSMHQVLTVPPTDTIRRTSFVRWVPKAFSLAPVVVYLAVLVGDGVTAKIADELSHPRTMIVLGLEVLFLTAIVMLTVAVIERMNHVDQLWEHYRKEVDEEIERRAATAKLVDDVPAFIREIRARRLSAT